MRLLGSPRPPASCRSTPSRSRLHILSSVFESEAAPAGDSPSYLPRQGHLKQCQEFTNPSPCLTPEGKRGFCNFLISRGNKSIQRILNLVSKRGPGGRHLMLFGTRKSSGSEMCSRDGQKAVYWLFCHLTGQRLWGFQ